MPSYPKNAPGSKNPSSFRGSFMPPNQFQYDFTNPEAALQSLASRYTPPPAGARMRPMAQQAQPNPQLMAPPQTTLPPGATSNTTPDQDPRSSQAEATFQAQAPVAPPARKTRWEIEREAAQAQYEAEIARHNEVSASGGYIHPATANRPFEKLQNRLGYLATMEKQDERRKTDDGKTQRLKAKWASQGETARLRRESNASAKASTQTTTTDTTAGPTEFNYGQQNELSAPIEQEPDPMAGIRDAVQGATAKTPAAKLAEIAAPVAPAPVPQMPTDRRAFEVPKEPTEAEIMEAIRKDNFNPYASNDALRGVLKPQPWVDPSLPAIEAPQGPRPQGVRKSFLEQLADRTFGPGGLVGPPLPADIAQDRISRAQTQAELDDARLFALAGEQQAGMHTTMGALAATAPQRAPQTMRNLNEPRGMDIYSTPSPQPLLPGPPQKLLPGQVAKPAARPTTTTTAVDPVEAVLPRQKAVRKPAPEVTKDPDVAQFMKGVNPEPKAAPVKPTGTEMFNWLGQLRPKVEKGIQAQLQKLEKQFTDKEITYAEYKARRESYHDRLWEKFFPGSVPAKPAAPERPESMRTFDQVTAPPPPPAKPTAPPPPAKPTAPPPPAKAPLTNADQVAAETARALGMVGNAAGPAFQADTAKRLSKVLAGTMSFEQFLTDAGIKATGKSAQDAQRVLELARKQKLKTLDGENYTRLLEQANATTAPNGRPLAPLNQRSQQAQRKAAEDEPSKPLTQERFRVDGENSLGQNEQQGLFRVAHREALAQETAAQQKMVGGSFTRLNNPDKGMTVQDMKDVIKGLKPAERNLLLQGFMDLNASGRLGRKVPGGMADNRLHIIDNAKPSGKPLSNDELRGFIPGDFLDAKKNNGA